MEVKCICCNNLLLDDIKDNITISFSSDFIKHYEPKDYPEVVLEIKCRKCKYFFTLSGRVGYGQQTMAGPKGPKKTAGYDRRGHGYG